MNSLFSALSGFIVRPLLTAVRTLTVIPLPGEDTEHFQRSLLYFPVAGLLLGVTAFGLAQSVDRFFPGLEWLQAVLLLLFITVLTGALHLDGLADWADGFFGGKTRERILEIMKDPRQGTFGVAAIVFDLGIKGILYASLLREQPWAIPFSLLISRSLQPLVLSWLSYARKEGGTAAPFCGSGARGWALAGLVPTVGLSLGAFGPNGLALAWSGALLAVALMAVYSRRKIGGVTGDVVGAMNEIAEITVLVVMVL